MQRIEKGDYSVNQLVEFLSEEANNAVDYIINVIEDNKSPQISSEFFSDVLRLDDYEYVKNPTGATRKALWGRTGVYVFVVKESFSLTGQQVRSYNGCGGAGFPDIHEVDVEKGQHFYQGSTCRSLQTRMNQHYSKTKDATGIKLNYPQRIIVKDKLILYLFPVKIELKTNHQFIKMIETKLHERVRAVTGSKRV